MVTTISKVIVVLNFLMSSAFLAGAIFLHNNRIDLSALKREREAERSRLQTALERINNGSDDNKVNHLKRLRADKIDADQRWETEKQKSEKSLKALDQQVALNNDELEKLRVSTNQRVGELETANQEQVAQRKKSTELKANLAELQNVIEDKEAKKGLVHDRANLENRLTQMTVDGHAAQLRATQMEQRTNVLKKQLGP